MKIFKMIIATVMTAVMLAGCGGSSIVGRWEDVNSSKRYFEFFSDGTYTSNDVNYTGGYSIDGNRLKLEGYLMPDVVVTFDVSGDTLTFYDDDGDVTAVCKKK